jgi:ribonuclease P protein component
VKKSGLAKNDRIYLNNDFKDILEHGVKVYGKGIVLWYRLYPQGEEGVKTRPSQKPRIAVIVTKKIGNAVQRNRCKRLLREAFRINRHLLKDSADCIFCPKDIEVFKDYSTAGAAFLALVKKANILKESKDL